MKLHLPLLVWVIIGIISLFSFSKPAFASYSFFDFFNSTLDDPWNIDPLELGSANIYSNDILKLNAVNSTKYPYLWVEVPETENIDIEVRFKFSGSPNFGAGIALSDTILPNGLTREVAWSELLYMVSPKTNTGFDIMTTVCPEVQIGCIPNQFNNTTFEGESERWYTLRIRKYSDKFHIYVDQEEKYISSITDKTIRYLWLGSPVRTGGVVWPIIEIDYIKISEGNILTSTVIIPGLGASWNVGAIMSGKDEGNWQIPGFVKNYDGIVASFKNARYVDSGQNKNLYVFPYDWRRPLSVLASRLKEFIDTNIPDDEQVNLVGHSMGGLVARSYSQTYGTAKVNKILTVGSPNMGTTKAYGLWEGALVFDDSWWSKVALELTTRFGVIVGETNIQTVHRTAPSLRDLLPTYPFLVFDDNSTLPLPTGNSNAYLENLNRSSSSINPITTALYSSDVSTNTLIKVVPHSIGDLGTWIDGKPTNDPFIDSNGDGTVTDFSAKGPFSNTLQGSGGHGELVTSNDNIKKVFSVLGLEQTKALSGINDGVNKVFVAALRSPGTIEVCNESLICNDELGIYFPAEKLFILPNYQDQNLIIKIIESGEKGTYKLHLGDIFNTAKWTVVGGNLLNSGQVDRYDIVSSQQGLLATLFDNLPPTTPSIIGFTNPELACGSVTNAKYQTVDWTDSIDNYGLAGYEYYVDYPLSDGSGRGIWNPSSLWTFSENYGSLNEGVHYIKVRAKDDAGNISEWSNICNITADWSPPIIVIKSPLAGTYLENKLPELNYEVIDNFDEFPDVVVSGYSSEKGNHLVSIVATDDAGNSASSSVAYTIQSPPSRKDQCKNIGWKIFSLFRFRNQGDCVSFVERNEISRNKYFWWL